MEKQSKQSQETVTNQSQLSSKQESTSEVIETGYKPRAPQKEIHRAMHNSRFVVAVCHRRMGKTVAAINQLIHSALKCDKNKHLFFCDL